MSIDPHLRVQLVLAGQRQARLQLWWKLAGCWAGAALAGWCWLGFARATGWVSVLAAPLLVLLALGAAVLARRRQARKEFDWLVLAKLLERKYPELDGRLLTAAQQQPGSDGQFNFLQERLLREVLVQSYRNDWTELIPRAHFTMAHAAQGLALLLLAGTLWEVRATGGHRLLAQSADFGPALTVTPGDTSLERGQSLVILARFRGPLPASVDAVLRQADGAVRRVPMAKSLSDPMFGCTVPDLRSNAVYQVEYGARRSREFKVTVFEYPRLERADAAVTYPAYTRQAVKRLPNTRRLSAVEGSRLDLSFEFNKPVASARLVAKDQERSVVGLALGTNGATATLKQWPLLASQIYELQLLDADGRTNKTAAPFVFEALSNRPPELRLATPRGDLRPSPLEEIAFDGTVWDDFGVVAYGLGYTVAGRDLQLVELGRDVPGQQKRPFHYLLRLEDLGVQPDQLISWFVWADDLGPDGQTRRTTGDLFFGEVRPFEEIFREASSAQADGDNEGGDDSQGGPSGQQGNRSGRLTELEKQIMIATWKLQSAAKSGSQRIKPEIRNPKPERSPKSEARNLTSQISNFKSAIGNRQSEVGDWKFEIGNLESHSSRVPTPRDHSSFVIRHSSFVGQVAPAAGGGDAVRKRAARRPAAGASAAPKSLDDLQVVLEAQEQALEQARAAQEQQADPRTAALWSTAVKEMGQALARLRAATNSPASLGEALTAEQAAYQALLKVQEHEYQVARQGRRNQRGNNSGQQRQMQRQLDQLDLTESENRYETQRQAPRLQSAQQREQLQAANRLQGLARRQQDLNDRFKELQSALAEARTEEQRAEVQRRLKRLEEEEQQMLADMDELRQRMERPDNQSTMADERRQLEQTRQDVQRAAEAAGQGAASQALAAGARAEEQLRQMRDSLRKENSSQFTDELRQMRAQARELARQQEELQQGLAQEANSPGKSLSDSPQRRALSDQLARQRERLTNLVDRATQVSEQAEASEPLLSRQLYDTVRRFTQTSAKDAKQLQEELVDRGLMTRNLLDRFNSSDPDGAKALDAASEMLRLEFLTPASEIVQRARPGLEDLKRGVERAAESVLGDDTDSLRLAQAELDRLTDQLQREMNQAQGGGAGTNRPAPGQDQPDAARAGGRGSRDQPQPGAREPETASAQDGQPQQPGQEGQPDGGQRGGQRRGEERNQPGAEGRNQPGGERQAAQAGRAGAVPENDGRRSADDRGGEYNTPAAGGAGGYRRDDLNRLLDERNWRLDGPLTGEDFVTWSERLRDVEEMIDEPGLRNQVALARERARLLRQELRRERKKPDWAVVRTQIVNPLTEVRTRIAEELARRESRDALVPIDRDPVPGRYSDLVRRYYEELGKDR